MARRTNKSKLEQKFISMELVDKGRYELVEHDGQEYLIHTTPIERGKEVTEVCRVLEVAEGGFNIQDGSAKEYDVLGRKFGVDTGILESGPAAEDSSDRYGGRVKVSNGGYAKSAPSTRSQI